MSENFSPESLPPAAALGVGDEIPPIVREMGWDQILKFNRYVTGGKDTKNIHTDDETARKAGLPRALATGRHPVSFISEHLIDWFGAGFVAGGEIDVAFVKPIFPGDTVTVVAKVKEIVSENEKRRVLLDISLVNQEGVSVTVGSASGLVDASASGPGDG